MYFSGQLLAEDHEDAKAAKHIAGKMKQFASWFTHGVPGGAVLRKSIYECKSGEAILDAVERFFAPRLAGEVPAESAAETILPPELMPNAACAG